ncbi:MAG: nuclear transport factor 2 family protein [Gemmatimonadaceae bacterium]
MEVDPGSDLPAAMVQRLCDATNRHDLDAIVDCFAPGYRNETPAHPSRGFQGREQVRRNWGQILGAVPDVSASVLRSVADGSEVWSEWEMRGTRRDGSAHLMRGVIVFGVEQRRAAWARFYLEPVDVSDTDVNEAVHRTVAGTATPRT